MKTILFTSVDEVENEIQLLTELLELGLDYLYILGDGINEVKIPVYLYAIVISCMSIVALNRKGLVSNKSFLYVFIGSLFFIISDSCIAFSAFKQKFYLSNVLIMLTYVTSQYLIVKGCLLHIKEKEA